MPEPFIVNTNLQVNGQEDTTQLDVQGHTTQNEPLQTWRDSAGDVLAQITGDGRFQIGELGLETPEAMVEANADIAASDEPKRGWQSLGRITGALADAVAWIVHELELLGTGGVSGLHTALRAKLTLNNSGDTSEAEIRAGDFEANNASDSLGKAVGVSSQLVNQADASITEGIAFQVAPPVNEGSIDVLVGLNIPDLTEGDENYAIRTGLGPVHFGDFLELAQIDTPPDEADGVIKIYSKADGKLYAKAPDGTEYDLASGGSRAYDHILVRDEKASGTAGGTFSSGAWRTRDLTTEVIDTGDHASLASNQITLAAGTYLCRISAPGYYVTRHQIRLQNITDGLTIAVGTNELTYQYNTVMTRSILEYRFTLNSDTVLEVQHRCENSAGTEGFGSAHNWGTEVYTVAEFWREPDTSANNNLAPIILIEEHQSQNTDAGAFNSGAWRTRTLNTKVVDSGSLASLSSSQITLAAGIYDVEASAPGYVVSRHQARLYDVTHSEVLLYGTSMWTGAGDQGYNASTLQGRITLSVTTVLELQHRCQDSNSSSNGMGVAANFGTEIYARIKFTVVSCLRVVRDRNGEE